MVLSRFASSRAITFLMLLATSPCLVAQTTNTFPSSGNVGIGTTSPTFPLDVNGAARASGLVTEASVATTWSSYVSTNISMNGQSIISVNVVGSNSTWGGVFLVQGTNSQTRNATMNNAQLIAWSGYNAAMNDVQALIMSNSSTTGYGATYLVFQVNGGPGAGNTATLSMSALGNNVNQISLSSSTTAPYSYTMATSQNTYQLVSGSNTITQSDGNVGIGITTPATKLWVEGGISVFRGGTTNQAWSTDVVVPINFPSWVDGESFPNAGMRLLGLGGNSGHYGSGISWGMAPQSDNTWLSGSYTTGQFLLAYNGQTLQLQGSNQNSSSGTPASFSPNTFLAVNGTGQIGIGTNNPGAQLEVNGNVKLTQGSGASITFPDNTVQATAWNGTTLGGDYAEAVDVLGDRTSYKEGDVIVIDGSETGKFTKSDKPYSKMVAGVYSTKPGLVGRRTTTSRPDKEAEVPMAMMGIVPTKVSAENGPIERGDLLVSSSTPGYAMKGTDRERLTGAVIGKALAPFDSKLGVIEVLVSLQ